MRPNLATDPARRDASAAAFVARLQRWWGAALPTGTVTLVLADVSAHAAAGRRGLGGRGRTRARRPLRLARRRRAAAVGVRVGPGWLRRRPRARGPIRRTGGRGHGRGGAPGRQLPGRRWQPRRPGSWSWPIRGQVVIDDATAEAIGDRLPPEVGLAELSETAATGHRAWVLVAPGLAIPPRAGACPYRGLMAFQPEDGDLFFGREEVVATTVGQLLAGGFMAVVGASGSGKSSLVRAGLIPAFRRAREGPVAVMTPGSDPDDGAATFGRTSSAVAPRRRPVRGGVHALSGRGGPRSLLRRADRPVRGRGHLRRGRAPRGLLRTLRRASAPGRGAGRASASARADADRRAAPGHRGSRRRGGATARGRPDRRDAGRRRRRARRAPAALPRPVRVVGPPGRPGPDPRGLPSTPAACGGRSPTRPRRSSSAAADRSRLLMRRMLLRLTELGETTEDTRRRVPLAELIPEGDGGAEATAVLEQLAGSRLLVVGDDSAEIAHEALIREWPRLRGWLAEDREALRTAPPADDGGSLLGRGGTRRRRSLSRARVWRRRSSWRARSGSSPASSASSWRRAGTHRTASCGALGAGPGVCASCSRSSRPRWWRRWSPARSRWSSAEARGARRSSRRPGGSPPSRGRSLRSIRTWRFSSRSRRAASTTRSTPAVRSSARSSTDRGSARGSRGSTRPSTPRRSARTAGSWPP